MIRGFGGESRAAGIRCAEERTALSPWLRSLILFLMAVRVESQAVMDLSREAFLTVRGSRVTGANQAARSFFEACGREQALVGASLDELWESAGADGGDSAGRHRLVRARASAGTEVILEVVKSRPSAPDAEYAIRVVRAAQEQDPQADSGRMVPAGRGVTDQLAAQRRLEQLSAAVNEATEMIVVIDPQAMEYVELNEATARNYGLTRELMMERGMSWVMRHTKARDIEQLRQRYRDAIDRYPEASSEIQVLAIEGRPDKTIEVTRRAVRMAGKWLILTVGRDVTERLRAERELHERMEELARSNRDLEQFAYVTSHDLSEPLRMVASYTQLLARRYGTHFDEDGREFMGYVVTGAQRMKQLIDDLLSYSRAGRTSVELREWPLDKVLDEALVNLAHVIRDSNARIERPAALPTLACDKTGMIQVFQNLIANAIKFRGEAPVVIRIEATQGDDGWTFSVADNGIGIESKYFERIFVIFQRLHARTAYEGTGIGLAICKKIIDRHAGAIWVESAPGQGASFKFRLPAQTSSSPGKTGQADVQPRSPR